LELVVPAFVLGTGVLICTIMPDEQPATIITSMLAIKIKMNNLFFFIFFLRI